VMATAPPTISATIGTSNPPKLRIDSIDSFPSEDPAERSGGADRDRTGGLLVANQALSQLSYSPLRQSFKVARFHCFKVNHPKTLKLWHLETLILVGLDRLELSTSPLSGVRSSHLSYRPALSISGV
jgi:hypothetical protein